MLLAFHKPYAVLSQFTPDGSAHQTLAGFGFPPGVYPVGRLDAESEGLLLLSDEAALNARLLHPRHGHTRLYWAQVERVPTRESLAALERGVPIGGQKGKARDAGPGSRLASPAPGSPRESRTRQTLPCRARLLEPQPEVPPREPPIRFRKNVPEAWIELALTEGKNRQVRRMTAAVGHPTLRLVRVQIGRLELHAMSPALLPGQWRELTRAERMAALAE